ncbi:acyloxyacyl hydrolase [Ferrimonas kyonanensis]|uniref:acyloxyacyl hydrolase n=1 Tax=Ferrimonas kyonanensis TaxID=364763 RepID=UPI00146F78AB|nr:acyloxyacyl hydrolase [Ferrimonas kyonanensis]
MTLLLLIFWLPLSATAVPALWLSGGYGPQPGDRHQSNSAIGLDWVPYHYARSNRQWLSVGASVARLHAHGQQGNEALWALSLFPQLTLNGPLWGNHQAFFQVRALGPTYLSDTSLGSRHQANHFAFQAQILAGIHFGTRQQHAVAIAYRHYSNANLNQPNDGLDVPFMLSVGLTL